MYVQLRLWPGPEEERERALEALARLRERLGVNLVAEPALEGCPRLPAPSPPTVYPSPLVATLRDPRGRLVGVTGRLSVTGTPTTLVLGRQAPVAITSWAGPWPVDEFWWEGDPARRYARFQVLLADGRAFLLHLTQGKWTVVARYD